MIRIDPKQKAVMVPVDSLKSVVDALEEIERVSLESQSIDNEEARSICIECRSIRDSLGLTGGVKRHPRFSSEVQS